MLSDDELALLADVYVVRVAEGEREPLWVGIDPLMLPEAHRLEAAGYLQRRWCRACYDQHWRATDAGAALIVMRNAELAALN
jgi:hypothetical protein